MALRVALGSDHAGYELKGRLAARLEALGYEVLDCGCDGAGSTDYPDYAAKVARVVAGGDCPRGILVCGTGIGMAMAANRIPGVRAATVCDRFTAEMSRRHNDANVLCLGARVLDPRHALELAEYWLTLEFEGGRHARRVAKIERLPES